MSEYSSIEKEILEIGKKGLFGNIQEFYKWYLFIYGKDIPYKIFSKNFHELIHKGVFIQYQNLHYDYIYNLEITFSNQEEFIAPTFIDYFPIQYVRSRLISFLNYHKIDTEILQDIIIGTVEAIENAVKYSSESIMHIYYKIDNNVFYIEIQNKYQTPVIEKDMREGKYNSSRTLMRGMLVMSKLFDEMDINLIENTKQAVFRGKKIIKHEKI